LAESLSLFVVFVYFFTVMDDGFLTIEPKGWRITSATLIAQFIPFARIHTSLLVG
jgi:hypothetical protein